MNAEMIGAAILGGVFGSGTLGALLYLALRGKLIDDLVKIFAKRSELNGFGDRMKAFETILVQARDTADSNSDAIIRLQEADRHRWEPIRQLLEKLSDRLDSHEKTLNGHDRAIERVTLLLDAVSKRLDRADR